MQEGKGNRQSMHQMGKKGGIYNLFWGDGFGSFRLHCSENNGNLVLQDPNTGQQHAQFPIVSAKAHPFMRALGGEVIRFYLMIDGPCREAPVIEFFPVSNDLTRPHWRF